MPARARLQSVRRIVVKVGTRVLVNSRGRPNLTRIAGLVTQIAAAHRAGREVVLVSSGAIGAGLEALKMKTRPSELPLLQMAAAVGQSRLMARYSAEFAHHQITVGQVLLTHDDLRDRRRHLNARHAMLAQLRHRIVPIVNENDAVAVDEIRFGDNDRLAALVTLLVDAEALVLLTNTNGLRRKTEGKSVRISEVASAEEAAGLLWQKTDTLSRGGMSSKLESAEMATGAGAIAVIADGRRNDTLTRLLEGADVGTIVGGVNERRLSSRKRWISAFQRVAGALVVDDGAANAIAEKGKSLLAVGVRGVEGTFGEGSLIAVRDASGREVARGLARYSAAQIGSILGKPSGDAAATLGHESIEPIIHRDDLVVARLNGVKK